MLHRQTANAWLAGIAMTAQIATALGPALDEPGALQQPSTVLCQLRVICVDIARSSAVHNSGHYHA